MIISNLPVLIVIMPLFGALLSPIISIRSRVAARILVAVFVTCSFVMSLVQLNQVITGGTIHYAFGNWEMPLGIEFVVDTLNGLVICLVSFMGMLSTYFSWPFLKGLSRFKSGGFTTVLALLIVGLLGMSSTGDLFNLYVFLEITSLSGYTLIAAGGDRGVISAFRYLLIGTIGASFYLVGVGFIYAYTGTLNMSDAASLLAGNAESGIATVAMVCFILAFGIKMALFPLHGWQPAAYAQSHPAATPLIAGVMGKIPAYAMVRFFFFIFDVRNANIDFLLNIVGVMGACGMIYGSLIAIRQKNIRKMLAYSSIAQMGYIAIGIAIGGYYGLLGSTLHIISHSFMKSGLFFSMGAVAYKYGTFNMNELGQLYRKMPKTVIVIVIGALSMIGIPPTAGFFSKWYLALGACQSGQYIYVAVLVVSSLLNAVYFFRLIEKIFMEKKMTAENMHPEIKGELSWNLMIPVALCGVGIIVLGLMNTQLVSILGTAIQEVM